MEVFSRYVRFKKVGFISIFTEENARTKVCILHKHVWLQVGIDSRLIQTKQTNIYYSTERRMSYWLYQCIWSNLKPDPIVPDLLPT